MAQILYNLPDYILIFAIAGAVTFLITPTIRYFALRFSIMDRRGGRKVHDRVVARFGGLSIYLGFMFAMLAMVMSKYGLEDINFTPFWTIITASTLILILGIYDDAKGADAKVKLFVQILAALLLVNSGFIIRIISNPFGRPFTLGVFSIPITILWLVGITNAINLIDGLDGLATGIIFICSLGLFSVFVISGEVLPSFFALALAGACLGFLRYNFSPAKIFMGDTGSMFLGFSVASLAILTSRKATTAIVFLVPIIGLAIPILDTSMALIRRVVSGRNPFDADREHIHHQLLKKNLTEKQVVYILWAVTLFLNIFACIISLPQ